MLQTRQKAARGSSRPPSDLRVEYTGEYRQLILTVGQMPWILPASAILV